MRTNRFTFLCSDADRAALTRIAEYLERSESDTLRWLIRRADRDLERNALSQIIDSPIEDDPQSNPRLGDNSTENGEA